MARVVSWQREFRIWHFAVSYSQLLLRSLDVERYSTRIDLLFSNVERMHVSSEYSELTVDVITSLPDPKLPDFQPPLPRCGKVFLINGGPDYVAAAHCQWHEDDGGAHSPSKFGPLRGTE
ncbi:hypothetical protein ACQP2T_18495 [Nonomuraea sp. CA-143628]|uniref:hypothetical protein n=1 Tax=Nonomuraea sp. CA-143628 TaxID=3239997 RepID=UPI003D8A0B2C